MTDYKEPSRGIKHRSLYVGLLYNIVIGFLLAVLVFVLIAFPSWYVIENHYATAEMQAKRRESYLIDLANYVERREITLATSDRIGGWVRDNPYVYLLIYQSGGALDVVPASFPLKNVEGPGENDKLVELAGSRIDEELSREELIAAAAGNGYYELELFDGSVIVAINEYTENLYYVSTTLVGILFAILTFVLALVRYIGVIIQRIKRFEVDVTIVSEVDMDYEIINEGRDEIANLSAKVETMRRTMLDHIKNEQEAREANTELITSISHDIRTPLTVLMGYIEMMKERGGDETMKSYIAATESTAMRLKNLSDDMFKYSLAFGETQKSIRLEEYDLLTLHDQLFTEHFVLMRENGYDIHAEMTGEPIAEGTTVRTDAPNLMRIVDNIFSNMRKYADKNYPIEFTMHSDGSMLTLESKNKIRTDTEEAESNGIGLKTCVRLGSLVAKKFEYDSDGESFVCRLYLDIKPPKA